jgi:hypothetical protein
MTEFAGRAEHTIRRGRDKLTVVVELRTVNGKQSATFSSPDIELTQLCKTLLLNWLRLKDGPDLPDGVCVIGNIRIA